MIEATRAPGTLVLLISAALSGCGSPAGTGGPGPVAPLVLPDCDVTFERIEALDAPTPLGPSALEVLQELGGERRSELVWLDAPANEPYLLEFGPERGASELSLRIDAADGALVYRSARAAPWAPEDTDCGMDALRIPIRVSLHSAGGALAETFTSVLEAKTPDQGRISHAFGPRALGGGLDLPAPLSLETALAYAVESLELEVLLWRSGSHGTLTARLLGTREDPGPLGPAPVAARHPLAIWPSALHCSEGFRGLPNDADPLGVSPRDVLAELARLPAEDLRWSDGSTTQLELTPAPPPDALCVAAGDVLEFDAAFRARTADERLDAEVVLRVRAAWGASDWDEITLSTAEADPAHAPPEAVLGGAGRPDSSRRGAPAIDLDVRYTARSGSGFLALPPGGSTPAGRRAAPVEGRWSR